MNAAALAHLALCRSRYIGVGPDAGVDEHGGRAPINYLLERNMNTIDFLFLWGKIHPSLPPLVTPLNPSFFVWDWACFGFLPLSVFFLHQFQLHCSILLLLWCAL